MSSWNLRVLKLGCSGLGLREVRGRLVSRSYFDRRRFAVVVENIEEVSPLGLYFFLISLSRGETIVFTLLEAKEPSSESSLMDVTGFTLICLVGLIELTCSDGIVLIELRRKLGYSSSFLFFSSSSRRRLRSSSSCFFLSIFGFR